MLSLHNGVQVKFCTGLRRILVRQWKAVILRHRSGVLAVLFLGIFEYEFQALQG